jgi:hypothetical protein
MLQSYKMRKRFQGNLQARTPPSVEVGEVLFQVSDPKTSGKRDVARIWL